MVITIRRANKTPHNICVIAKTPRSYPPLREPWNWTWSVKLDNLFLHSVKPGAGPRAWQYIPPLSETWTWPQSLMISSSTQWSHPTLWVMKKSPVPLTQTVAPGAGAETISVKYIPGRYKILVVLILSEIRKWMHNLKQKLTNILGPWLLAVCHGSWEPGLYEVHIKLMMYWHWHDEP